MTKTIKIIIGISFLFAVIFLANFFIIKPIRALSDSSSQKNQQANNLLYSIDKNTNKVTSITSEGNGIPLNLKRDKNIDSSMVANQFIKDYGYRFGLRDSTKELYLVKKQKDELGMEHVHYNQTYNGIPVFGGQMIVHLGKDLSVESANGKILPDISSVINPAISKDEAINKAKELWKKQFNLNSAEIIKTNLYIFNKGLIENKPDNKNYLVWEVELYNQKPIKHEFYYIDAGTGDLVYQITGIKNAISRRIYDCSLGSCVLDYSLLGYTYGRSEGKSARGTNPIYGGTDVDDLYNIASSTHNYFYYTFGLNGANNQSGLGDNLHNLYSQTDGYTYIDYYPGESCPNAYWDGFSINFCEGLVYTDVVAHEYTHAVDQFSVEDAFGNPVGLTYADESGALNEAFSDIFAEAVEDYSAGPSDWLIGEDVNVVGLVGPLRDLSNPSSLSDSIGPYPDRFYSENYYCTSGSCNLFNDYCGVHHNNTVVDYAAYLTAMGGTFNGCTISGIGRAKEEAIFYRALTQYLITSSDFNDTYTALINSCHDLYGVSSSDCVEVTKALQAVEMDQSGACSGVAEVTPLCSIPSIYSVSSDKADGYYNAGYAIDIDVTFTDAVTSTGSVTVTLDTGGSCSFTVTNSTTGNCDYTVAAGENSSDLTVASISGTIANQYGTVISNFTPSYNLGVNKNFTIDTINPTGNISINNGAAATNSSAVTLTLSASDTNGVPYMNFYDASYGWYGWETYTTTKSWTIDTSTQGIKTIYVQFLDAAGNMLSTSAFDDIIYDTTAPTTSVSPSNGYIVKGKTVTFTADETATIYYTTDSTIPTTSSTVYTSPIAINSDTTFYYFAADLAGNSESYKTTTFIVIKPSSIITAAGTGGGPHIRAFNYSGKARSSPNFLAFSKSYKGGVHVASCDVDGDGKAEIITGIGAGEEPWVKVFEENGKLITQFLAYGKNIRGGVFVACADLDGLDKKAEIITGVPEGYGPQVRVFSGETGKPKITNGFFAYAKNVRTGIRVAAGDLDGDGKSEIICGTGNGAGTQVRTFSSTGVVKFTPGFFVYDKSDRSGIKVAAGDVNGDGLDEIITGSGSGKAGEVKIYDRYGKKLASFYPYGKTYKNGIKIASGDIDADGTDEIVTGTEAGGGPQVRVFRMNGTTIGSFFAYDSKFRGGVEVAVGSLD